MNDLISLINSFNSDEVSAFLAFAKARNQRTDVKNIELFQFIQQGARVDLDIKIYGKPNKNALHALKNRLKESLIDFTAINGFASESQEEMQLFKLVLAARIFLEREQYGLGFKMLKKAASMAIALESYVVLQEVYYTQVQYAHLNDAMSLEETITAYKENEKRYLAESRLVMAYATVQKALKTHPTNVYKVIKTQLDLFQISIDQQLSFKSLYQLMNIATEAATLKSDYAGVSIFMNHIYDIVELKKYQAAKHLYYHCEILYLMAGACFRNKDFNRSQFLINELDQEIIKQKGKYKKQFEERVLLLKALNYNYTGNAALAIKEVSSLKKVPLRIQLAHATFLFQQDKPQEARRVMNSFMHSDRFYEKKEDLLWVLKKNVLEILIYMELNQPDLVESKMRSFKKKFRSRLLDLKEDRVLAFMSLLRLYFEHPFQITEDSFKKKVTAAFTYKTVDREDIFIMSFYAYLKAKMENKSIYSATLELVN